MSKTLTFYIEGIVGYEDGFDPSTAYGHTQRRVEYDDYYDYEISEEEIAECIVAEYSVGKIDKNMVALVTELIKDEFIDIDSEGMEDWLKDKFEEDARLEAQNG